MANESNLDTLLAKFVPCDIEASLDSLAPDIQRALPHIVAAMRGIDRIFHRQIGTPTIELFAKLERAGDTDSALYRAARHFNGPYNKLDGGKPFVEGVPAALPQKALYPADVSETELDAYITAHPHEKAALLSPTTVVVRDGDALRAVPYSEHFRAELQPIADELRAAAEIVAHAGLSAFLRNRADALCGEHSLTESDAEWVRLIDAPLEVVIGPFEVYEDELKGAKAFYEGMLFKIDFDAGARLQKIEASLEELAACVPSPAGSKPARGGMAPMIVADEIIATGDGYSGIIAAAFNLPNDPWVRGEVGWKQVMIRNVMQAKFENCTAKIAQRMLVDDQVSRLDFDAFFYFVLLHEVTHGLGPAYRGDGRSVNEACGKYYTALEEAKADTGSVVLMCAKNGSCGIPKLSRDSIGASYLAGLYRSIRFGLHEAHGKANVVEYNFYRRAGVLQQDGDKIRIESDTLAAAAKQLLEQLCTLQAAGSETELRDFLDDYGAATPELEAAVERLADLPIDIMPRYPV